MLTRKGKAFTKGKYRLVNVKEIVCLSANVHVEYIMHVCDVIHAFIMWKINSMTATYISNVLLQDWRWRLVESFPGTAFSLLICLSKLTNAIHVYVVPSFA